jgi:hypothetical protein
MEYSGSNGRRKEGKTGIKIQKFKKKEEKRKKGNGERGGSASYRWCDSMFSLRDDRI